jgi:hypothetical protein
MDSHDPSGIVCDTSCDMCLKDSIYNQSNGSITLTFEHASTHKQLLIVKLVEFNSIYYISFGGHILPLRTFYSFKTAHETSTSITVSYGDNTTLTYKHITTTQLMTIMSAVEDAVVDNDIYSDFTTQLQDDCTESESESILDSLIAPPNPDTLHSPNSNPMTTTDQIAFLIGIVGFLLATLHSVYLAIYAITR